MTVSRSSRYCWFLVFCFRPRLIQWLIFTFFYLQKKIYKVCRRNLIKLLLLFHLDTKATVYSSTTVRYLIESIKVNVRFMYNEQGSKPLLLFITVRTSNLCRQRVLNWLSPDDTRVCPLYLIRAHHLHTQKPCLNVRSQKWKYSFLSKWCAF